MRSSKNYRGSTVDAESNTEFVFESGAELDFLRLLQVDPLFVDVVEQPDPIDYVDEDGVGREHTFDFFALTRCGLRVYFDVKPKERVASSGILNVHRLIEEQHGRSFADRMLVRTEEHMHPDDVADAIAVLRARRLPCPQADEVVARIVGTMSGKVGVEQIVEISGLASAAYNAIVRMVGSGVLATDDGRRVSYRSMVRRVAAAAV